MRRKILLTLDIALVGFATLFALALRDNFDVSQNRLLNLLPYMTATLVCAAIVFVAMGLDRSVWRFASRPDYFRIILASLVIVVAAVAITFALNRLEGVARSLPVLQFLACVTFLIGARGGYNASNDIRRHREAMPSLFQFVESGHQTTVLIVGISRFTKVYLQAVEEFARGRIRIAGLLSPEDRDVGRLVATHPVIGVPSEIESLLDNLDVHGVSIDQIVIASPFQSLARVDREALLEVERSRDIPLRFLAEDLGLLSVEHLSRRKDRQTTERRVSAPQLSFHIQPNELKLIAGRRYWVLKRVIDCLGASILLILAAPIMAITALLIAGSVGLPVLFWQQRPGLGGRPFRLYKFRTMRPAHAPNGRRLTDDERASLIGNFMRRTRLDELPQLINILRGDMCFIGPRPLLPCDQSDAHRARLLVRPGLTGWAQVVGGRDISPEDKAALDVWYVRNASLLLDLQISIRTAFMVVFGERISRPLIEKAWRDLRRGGVLHGEISLAMRTDADRNPATA